MGSSCRDGLELTLWGVTPAPLHGLLVVGLWQGVHPTRPANQPPALREGHCPLPCMPLLKWCWL